MSDDEEFSSRSGEVPDAAVERPPVPESSAGTGGAACPSHASRQPSAENPESAKSSINRVSGRRVGEESPDYPVIAQINDRWRVVTCRAGIQWILQRRRGDHWTGYWFCRTREALIRGAREHAGEIDGIALVILLRLPERIDGGAA